MNTVRVVDTREACLEACRELQRAGASVALVPTMGYLHSGHATLLCEARRRADYVVATVFINPAQFGPEEDLDRYPRDIERDLDVCRAQGTDLVFVPGDPAHIYPSGYQTWVDVGRVTRHFCGASRTGHFRGVTTVVAKLFNLVRPDVAVFGEKDFQQLVAVRTMARDLDMGVRVVGVPTVREPDGLALSSRNALLGEVERGKATSIVRGLRAARAAYASGERRAGSLVEACGREVAGGAAEIDYVGLADCETLAQLDNEALAAPSSRLLVAAFFDGPLGRVRLIDNAPVGEACSL